MFCPVCFDTRDGPRVAFFLTTIALSLLPLMMLGGLWLWLRARSRAPADQPAPLTGPASQ